MNNHKLKRIILVTNTLSAGGAEKMLLNLAIALRNYGYSIQLVSTANQQDFFEIPASIERIKLDLVHTKNSKVLRFFKRIFSFRKLVKSQPNAVIISFLENVNIFSLLSTCFLPNTLIISVRNHPEKKKVTPLLGFLRKTLYPHANHLVVQTESIAHWCKEHGLHKDIAIIPNFIANDFYKSNEKTNSTKLFEAECFQFIAAGRLVPQKGFDLLINAALQLKTNNLKFSINIYGEGPLEKELRNQIDSNGLKDFVYLKPVTKNLRAEMLKANAFVLSSRFEGFPNVLLEAMSLGLPVVSFDCPSGPGDIITHELNGLLVPAENVKELADNLTRVLQDELLRTQIAKGAIYVQATYSETSILNKWLQIINS